MQKCICKNLSVQIPKLLTFNLNCPNILNKFLSLSTKSEFEG